MPLEVAASIPDGSAYPGGGTVGADYTGIFQSLVLDLDPPTLLPFNASEEIHVNAASGSTATPVLGTNGAVHFINPSPNGGNSYVTFTLRLSNREAGISDTAASMACPMSTFRSRTPTASTRTRKGWNTRFSPRTISTSRPSTR